MLEQLQKHLLYVNLKKCQFYQEELGFLGYIVSHQGIQIEKDQIKAVRDWFKPQSICDIQVFLEFANFYWKFIQRFSMLATLLTSMLKTTSAAGLIALVKIGNKNLKQDGKEIQVEN